MTWTVARLAARRFGVLSMMKLVSRFTGLQFQRDYCSRFSGHFWHAFNLVLLSVAGRRGGWHLWRSWLSVVGIWRIGYCTSFVVGTIAVVLPIILMLALVGFRT